MIEIEVTQTADIPANWSPELGARRLSNVVMIDKRVLGKFRTLSNLIQKVRVSPPLLMAGRTV